MLHIEISQHDRLLTVTVGSHYHPVVVVHGIVNALCSVFSAGNIPEQALDFSLNLGRLDVAHYDYRLQIGAIPFLVIVAQIVVREAVYDVHRTYGKAVLVFCSSVHNRHHTLHHALCGFSGTAHAPLLMYHAPLLIYLFIGEQQGAAPVVQNEQGRIKHGLTPYRYGRDIVHRLVNARIGVEIGPEFHAHALAPRYDTWRLTVTPEVRGAIESHVFQEVGQSTLPGFLQDGAHPLGNVEVGNARLLGIVADIIG